MAHNLTEAALPIALAIRADGGWDSLGGWTTLGLLIAVLVLLVRVESALVYVARAEAGLPVVEDTAAVAAPRRAGLARARRALGFAPFFRAFVAIEFSFLALAAAIWDAVAGDLDGHADAGDRAGAGGGRDRRPGGWRRSSPPSGCDDRASAAWCSRRAGARRSCGPRSTRCSPRRASTSTSWWSATAGSPRACPRACARWRCPRTSGSPAGATPACRRVARRAAVLPRRRRPAARRRTRWRAWPRCSRRAGRRAGAAARRALHAGRAAARLGAAAAGRRPGALERRHRRLGGRGGDAAGGVRAGRRLAGGVPLRPRGRSTSPGA